MITQREKADELIKLIKENPVLEILPMVDTECVHGDDYSCWMASWGSAKVDEYWCDNERVWFRSDDEDELIDDWINNNYYLDEFKDMKEEDVVKIAEKEVSNYEWTKAIIVRIREY